MILYIHHVPGRLRVCLAMIKHNRPAAATITAALAEIHGVTSVAANPVTGSVTVLYDRECFDPSMFWGTLHRLGYIDQTPCRGCDNFDIADRPASTTGDYLAKAVLGSLLEQCVGRSAAALIGVLI
jgi:hypothetical protein